MNFRVKNGSVFIPSIIESSSYTYSSYSIKPVCILDNFKFPGIKFFIEITSFERNVFYNLAYVFNGTFIYMNVFKEFS